MKQLKQKEGFLKEKEVQSDNQNSNLKEREQLVKSLEYLGKLLNLETALERKEIVSEWYEELQKIDADTSLTMEEQLQKSLECLGMILLSM